MCLPKTDGWRDGIEYCFWRSGIERLGSHVGVRDAPRLTGKLTLQASDLGIIERPRIKRVAQWSLSAWRSCYAPTDLDRRSLLIADTAHLRPCVNFSEVRNENVIVRGHCCSRAERRPSRARNGSVGATGKSGGAMEPNTSGDRSHAW